MTYTKKSDYQVILEGANSDAFSKRIVELISDFKSVANLARACGLSESVLRKYRDKISEPSRDNLIKIALNAGVTLEWLATGYGPKYHDDIAGVAEGALSYKDGSVEYDRLLDDVHQAVLELESVLKNNNLTIDNPQNKAKLIAMCVDHLHKRPVDASEPVSAQILRFIKFGT